MNEIIEAFINSYKEGSADIVWDKFLSLTENEKKKVFSKLLDVAASPKNTNKAVITPNVASVIKRKLRPGVEFNKWYEAWLPPVKPANIANEVVRDYFPVPTRVVNLLPINNEDEFLTIGFVYNPFDNMEELLNTRPKELKESELECRAVNEDLLADSEVSFYTIISDDIFGL
ncbi:MAG: hypothetical protein K0R14_1115 [Burkholderiales bacterium]|jgi:hypothetical protein|nr:hypothetical protein [Burkholderiales bacterium]